MELPKLPEGMRWSLKESYDKKTFIHIIPDSGYEWAGKLDGRSRDVKEISAYAARVNVKDPKSILDTSKDLMSKVFGPTMVVPPKVRKK
jgi:hypothetical protein